MAITAPPAQELRQPRGEAPDKLLANCQVFAYPQSVRCLSRLTNRKVDAMARQGSLQDKIEKRIADLGDASFLTREFADLGPERQVLRALAKAVKDGALVKLGYGVYGRARRSGLTGEPMLAAADGFREASRLALDKLGVKWAPTSLEQAYLDGRSTQIPANATVRIQGRFKRRLAYRGRTLGLER